jgi:hypothetical protein
MSGMISSFFGRNNGNGGGATNGNQNGGQNSNNNAENNGNNNDKGGGNNASNNDSFVENIWTDPPLVENGNNNNNNANNSGNNNNNNNTNNNNSGDPLGDYINELEFTNLQLSQENLGKLQNGDFSVLGPVMHDFAKQAIRHALITSNKLVNNKLQQSENRILERANNSRHADSYVDKMHNALEFTRDKAIEPVAKSVMAKALQKGQTHEQAIETVRQFFDRVGGAVNGGKRGRSQTGRNSFAGANNDDGEDFTKWLAADDVEV